MGANSSENGGRASLARSGYIPLAGSNIIVFIGLFSLSPILPSLNKDFAGLAHVDVLVQYVGAAASFSFAVACLFCGWAIARWGYRSVYIGSLLLFGLAGSSAWLSDSLYEIILTRVIVGIACAGVVNCALVAVNSLLDDHGKARVLGLQSVVGNISAITLLPLIGELTSTGWRAGFLVHSVSLLFIPLVMRLPKASGPAPADHSGSLGVLVAASLMGPLICLTAVFVGMAMFAISMFPPILLFKMGFSDARLLSIPPTAAVLGGVVGAFLVMQIGNRLNGAIIFSLVLLAMSTGLLVISLNHTVVGVSVGTFIAGSGSGAFAPILYAAAIKASALNPAPALGLVNTLLFGSMLLFPAVAMPLSEALGGAPPMLMAFVLGGLVLAGFFVAGNRFPKHKIHQ